MKISVLGLGYYGLPLAVQLRSMGHSVSGSVTSFEKKKSLSANYPDLIVEEIKYPQLPTKDLLNSEIVILNIPPFSEQLAWYKSWPWSDRTWVIFISSTSVNKSDGNGPTLLAQEEWIKLNFSYYTILRFAGLIGGDRHPGKILSGRQNIKGRLWPVNLIHLDDAIGFTQAIIDQKKMNMTIDVVSDEHRTKEEFYTEYASRKNLTLPHFDQTDASEGQVITNEELKKIYQLKWPTMLGKSL